MLKPVALSSRGLQVFEDLLLAQVCEVAGPANFDPRNLCQFDQAREEQLRIVISYTVQYLVAAQRLCKLSENSPETVRMSVHRGIFATSRPENATMLRAGRHTLGLPPLGEAAFAPLRLGGAFFLGPDSA